jgi:hypothetical protein
MLPPAGPGQEACSPQQDPGQAPSTGAWPHSRRQQRCRGRCAPGARGPHLQLHPRVLGQGQRRRQLHHAQLPARPCAQQEAENLRVAVAGGGKDRRQAGARAGSHRASGQRAGRRREAHRWAPRCRPCACGALRPPQRCGLPARPPARRPGSGWRMPLGRRCRLRAGRRTGASVGRPGNAGNVSAGSLGAGVAGERGQGGHSSRASAPG